MELHFLSKRETIRKALESKTEMNESEVLEEERLIYQTEIANSSLEEDATAI